MQTKPKHKISHTLLSNWLYSFESDSGYEKFVNYLNLKFEPPTKQMLDGVKFEGLVNAALDGQEIDPTHEWYEQIMACKDLLQGSRKQVDIYKEIEIDGDVFLLHGILDFLMAGEIFDTKFSKTYEENKYFNSTQHPMYFELVPEARKFTYVICDGKYIYREQYYPEDAKPIKQTIKEFMRYIRLHGLYDVYVQNWTTK